MPKMKTKRGLAKRIHVNGSGYIKTKVQGYNHNSHSKTHKRIRQGRKASTISRADQRRLKRLITK